MKQQGIAAPTRSPARIPSEATMMIITSTTAMIRPDSKSTRVRLMYSLWSSWNWTLMVEGMRACSWVTASRTFLTVSRMLAPGRLTTSMVKARSPSMRVVVVDSLKVRRTLPTSPRVTTLSPLVLIGMASTSAGPTTTPGIFTAKSPWRVCRSPAGISWLFELITRARSEAVML